MSSAPRILRGEPSGALVEFSSDVVTGLSQPGQKEIPSKYLWNEVGSALFDAICMLPEYGLSRAGMRLLQRHAPEMVAKLPAPVIVAELGSGTGQKTRWLLEALAPVILHRLWRIGRRLLTLSRRLPIRVGKLHFLITHK